jgi:hypothetical protein
VSTILYQLTSPASPPATNQYSIQASLAALRSPRWSISGIRRSLNVSFWIDAGELKPLI